MDFIASYWYVWLGMTIICLGTVEYILLKRSKNKNFLVTGAAAIGCLIAFFQALGAISAILTIISLILRLIVWKVTSH